MRPVMSKTAQHGYLVIADISGYTSFVAKTELEHSHEILSELLELLVERIEPLMTISKLEGDAVFAYAPRGAFIRGATLIDFIESMYVAFRDRQISMKRATTCTCNACRNISSLDLKFFVHCGEYIQQKVVNIRELVGTDVNLVHRLTKNHVSDATGWRAYIMVTEQCRKDLGVDFTNSYINSEEYEHLGEIRTYNIDLHQRYSEISEQRHIMIEEEDADFVFVMDFPVPSAVAWEWVQDPERRNQWNGGHVHWSAAKRVDGRAGVGSSNHCAHGESLSTEVIVDWHPFEYSTAESFEKDKITFTETFRFEPLPDGGTRVVDLMVMHKILPRFLRRAMLKFVLINQHKYDKALAKAALMAGVEFAKAKME